MATRCEYCGQLFEGLSCPHCGAPRCDDAASIHDAHRYVGNSVTINGDCNVVSVTNGDVKSDVSVSGNGNDVHITSRHSAVFYADDSMYWTSDGVPSEETDHVAERKRAKKITLDVLVTLAPILSLMVLIFLILALLGYKG